MQPMLNRHKQNLSIPMLYNMLICDDHSIVRSGIKALIKENIPFQRIDEAENDAQLVHLVKSTSYDLVLLDINIPGADFVHQMDWLKIAAPGTRILIFTTHPEDIYGRRSLQLGAKGYLNKTASNTEIIHAIKKVLEGGTYISNTLKELMSGVMDEEKDANPFNKLSVRELEIAMLINNGQSLPQICATLNIQYSTANTHKRRIFEKLNVYNTLALSRLMTTFNVTE